MYKIKNFITILILGLVIQSCEQKYNLTVEIEDLGNDTLLVNYMPVSQIYGKYNPVKDTIISINNKFIFESPYDEPISITINLKKVEFKDGSSYYPMHKRLNLIIKPDDHIIVKGKLHDYYLEYEAKGSNLIEEYSQLREKSVPEISQFTKIELQIKTLSSKNGDKELINNLYAQQNKIRSIIENERLKFIKSNWNKELAAYYLAKKSYDTVGKYYENLDTDIKNGIFKNMLEIKYKEYQRQVKIREAEKNIVPGRTAPGFSLQSLSGTKFSLNQIENKIIVLDFWGSWCGACIEGYPKMKKYYNKYKNQIEVVGIACFDTEDKWKKSIEKNNLDWQNVINDEDSKNDVSIMYGIKGYPTKIILDKDKKILAKFLGETDEFYKKLDELMKN